MGLTSGWPGNAKMTSGLPTTLPGPQIRHGDCAAENATKTAKTSTRGDMVMKRVEVIRYWVQAATAQTWLLCRDSMTFGVHM